MPRELFETQIVDFVRRRGVGNFAEDLNALQAFLGAALAGIADQLRNIHVSLPGVVAAGRMSPPFFGRTIPLAALVQQTYRVFGWRTQPGRPPLAHDGFRLIAPALDHAGERPLTNSLLGVLGNEARDGGANETLVS